MLTQQTIDKLHAMRLRGLAEGQKLTFDIVTERGKAAASNLQEG